MEGFSTARTQRPVVPLTRHARLREESRITDALSTGS